MSSPRSKLNYDHGADDRIRKKSLLKLRTLSAMHQSDESCAVESKNISNNRNTNTSVSIDCNNGCGDHYKGNSAAPSASIVAQQQSLHPSGLTPSHPIIRHQPSSLLRRSMYSSLSAGNQVEDVEMRTKKRVTFQDHQEQRRPDTKRSLVRENILLATSAPKDGNVTLTHHLGEGKQSSNKYSEHDDDADGTVTTVSPTIVAQHHPAESLRSIKDLSLLQLISIAADVTSLAASSAADVTASATKSMRNGGFKSSTGIKFGVMKHQSQEHLAPLSVIVKPTCEEYNEGNQLIFSAEHDQISALAPEEVVGKNGDSRLQTNIASTHIINSDIGGHGGNSSGVDYEGGSGDAVASKGVELVAPQSTLVRNELVWQSKQNYDSYPPLMRRLRKAKQEKFIVTPISKVAESLKTTEKEEKKMINQQHQNVSCNVAEASVHRVDNASVPLRRIRRPLPPHVDTKEETEKKYVARLRKLAASHQASAMAANDTNFFRQNTSSNFFIGSDSDNTNGGVEIDCLGSSIDSPKGVDELCQFFDGYFLTQGIEIVQNDKNDKTQGSVEVGNVDVYEYEGAADSCVPIERRKSFSSFEEMELSNQRTTFNMHWRKPRRIVSKLIQKVKPFEVGKNLPHSIQAEDSSVGSSTMVTLIRPDQSSCTSYSHIHSMSAVYSQDSEKMFDRKTYTEMEWVSVPDDIDSVVAKSVLTFNTDPMDIHDLTSWNFDLPSANVLPIATARDCNYGNDLESAYENFGVEQQIIIKLSGDKSDNAKKRHLSHSNPVDVDDVSANHDSTETSYSWKVADDNAESLVRLDDCGFDWLCGDVNGGGGWHSEAEATLERIFDDVGNHVSDLVPLCDSDNSRANNDENHDCHTEFDGSTEVEGWADDATLCDDGATPPPKEALAKTSAIRLQSVVFVEPNVKNPKRYERMMQKEL